MKLLIKSVLILFVIFTSMLLIIKFSGLLTVEDIKEIFVNLKSQPSYILGSLIVLLLFIDLFIGVPIMTVIILAGYFIVLNLLYFILLLVFFVIFLRDIFYQKIWREGFR